MELGIIKNDVINELRSNRYFNEQEITRLVQTEALTYKERILSIATLAKENANIIEAMKLIELYFPSQQKPISPAVSEPAE